MAAGLGACAAPTVRPTQEAAPLAAPSLAPDDLRIDSDADPSIAILDLVVSSGTCTRLDRLPGVLLGLPDSGYRMRLGAVAAEGHRHPGPALTEWLVLAARYQALCGLSLEPTAEPAQYIGASTPIESTVIERAIAETRCAFLAEADAQQAWPYEARIGEEVLLREFNEAEVTRRQWKAAVQEYLRSCEGRLGSRERVRAEATIERLDRMIGLDDPMLMELRSNLMDAMEAGDHEKVLAYARAVAQRETLLDAQGAARHRAKLAALEGELGTLNQGTAAEPAAAPAEGAAASDETTTQAPGESWQTQVSDLQTAVKHAKTLRKMAPEVPVPRPGSGGAGRKAAETAADLARRAKVSKTAAKIVRKLF
jgi:hypothetical protein